MMVFKPSEKMKTLYFIYAALAIGLGYLSWSVPLTLYLASTGWPYTQGLATLLHAPLIPVALFVAYWVPKYYDSITFMLTDTEIVVSRGVFWKVKSIVPYNRVTNVDVVQGPISRWLGVATLKVQTAGYSAPQGRRAEAVLEYLEEYEAVREEIMRRVRGVAPIAVEAGERPTVTLADVVSELKRIRELLEELSPHLRGLRAG